MIHFIGNEMFSFLYSNEKQPKCEMSVIKRPYILVSEIDDDKLP